jgi:hypothetical protein
LSLLTFKPVIWSAKLLEQLSNAHVYAKCFNRDYEGEIKSKGDTVTVNAIGDVTISDFTDASGLSAPESLHGAGASLTIDQQKSFHFKITDIDQAQVNVELMSKYMERAAWALADAVDLYLSATVLVNGVPSANQLNSGATYVVGPGAGDTDAYQLLVDLDVRLSENNVPNGGRWVVVPPSFYGVLRKDDRFVNFGTEANRAAMRGADLGQVANLMVRQSNNCPSSGTGSSKVWTILAGHDMASSYAEQVTKTEGYRPELQFSDAMKGLLTYGAHVFLPHALAYTKVNIAATQ